jgi:hypothetical protein
MCELTGQTLEHAGAIVELTAKLNALVAKHYGLNRDQLQVILESFDGFEEDKDLVNLKDIEVE